MKCSVYINAKPRRCATSLLRSMLCQLHGVFLSECVVSLVTIAKATFVC
jgi:hypothetical protein